MTEAISGPHCCPACNARADSRNGERILGCRSCGHRWMWTSEAEQHHIEQSVYTHDYAGYRVDPVFEQAIRALLQIDIVPRLPPQARLLDVGCGSGEFLAAAEEKGLKPKGIDVSEDAARLCRNKGHDAVSGDFLTLDLGSPFDAVTMWDVIEHLRDPAAFFERTGAILAVDGVFIGKVPGFGTLSVGLSRRI